MAYPALLTPSFVELLPSVNHYSSGFSMAWSVRSDLQASTWSRVLRQECVSSGLSAGINVVQLRVWHVLRVSSGEGVEKQSLVLNKPASS